VTDNCEEPERISTKAMVANRHRHADDHAYAWVLWAVQMLEDGEDTPGLRQLAAQYAADRPVEDGWSMEGVGELADQALAELGLDEVDEETAVKAYAIEVLEGVASGSMQAWDAA
jgi:hypothetical protein